MAKKGWGGQRAHTGGKRKNAGRKYKFYPPIFIDFKPTESRETICRLVDDLIKLGLSDQISDRKAASMAHLLEIGLKARIPSLQEEKFHELEQMAAETRKLLDAGNTDQTELPRSEDQKKPAAKGSGSVDNRDKDSQAATV